MQSTDFWWLSPSEASQFRWIYLFHQEPYSDEPNTERGPTSCPMLGSDMRYTMELISQWKASHKNVNLFRSDTLYSSVIKGKELVGPLVLDIDRVTKQNGGYLPDFERALKDTRLLVKEYCSNLSGKDYRVIFTGHKGFHIEIRPKAVGILPYVNLRQSFDNLRKNINKKFGANFIDLWHSHIRLHNSINRWIDYSGETINCMNFEVNLDGLFSLSAEDIFAKGKELALIASNS